MTSGSGATPWDSTTSRILIHRHILQLLHNARRPFDPERVDRGGVAQTEVGDKSRAATPSPIRSNLPDLPDLPVGDCRMDMDLGADGGSIRRPAAELDFDPVVSVATSGQGVAV